MARRVAVRRAKRGRPSSDSERSLSREMILDASVALIDEVGLEKFSVRELAQRLGVFPATIHWHLSTRNELLASTVNHILSELAPPPSHDDWKAWLTALFRETRRVVQRHPNIAPVITSQLLSNAGADFKLVDRILEVLEGAGFRGANLLAAYDVVVTGKLGFVAMEFAALPSEDRPGWTRVMRQTVEGLPETAYPHIERYKAALANKHFILRWENGVTVPLDASFEAYVYVIIEGLRQLLTR
jgi:TetR/AcrR family tetracycline transcriptional repressor